MIFMKAAPGAQLTGINGMPYSADADGLISNVETHDVTALREQGAGHATVPHLKHLKLNAAHALYFEGATHRADANGILRNVPRDHAAALIEGGAAREATEAELATPEPEVDVPLSQSEPVVDLVTELEPTNAVAEPIINTPVERDSAPAVVEPAVTPEPAIIPEGDDTASEITPAATLAE